MEQCTVSLKSRPLQRCCLGLKLTLQVQSKWSCLRLHDILVLFCACAMKGNYSIACAKDVLWTKWVDKDCHRPHCTEPRDFLTVLQTYSTSLLIAAGNHYLFVFKLSKARIPHWSPNLKRNRLAQYPTQTFLLFGFYVRQVRTMDQNLSSKTTRTILLLFGASQTTLAIQGVASSLPNEKGSVGRIVIQLNKVPGLVTGKVTNKLLFLVYFPL